MLSICYQIGRKSLKFSIFPGLDLGKTENRDISITPTLQRNPFLKQFCLENMYSCSSDYLWYPHYPGYQGSCYQNVISRDNTGLSPADNIHWLGCIIAVFRRMAFREGGQFTAHKKQAQNSMKTSALGLSP